MKKGRLKKKKKLNPGDLVSVVANVHDNKMPIDEQDRLGLVVESVGPKEDQYIIMFSNGCFLKFHRSQLCQFVKV